jgi:hypothetical protein
MKKHNNLSDFIGFLQGFSIDKYEGSFNLIKLVTKYKFLDLTLRQEIKKELKK